MRMKLNFQKALQQDQAAELVFRAGVVIGTGFIFFRKVEVVCGNLGLEVAIDWR